MENRKLFFRVVVKSVLAVLFITALVKILFL